MNRIERISLHGGHSGQFCSHAQDCLEDIIQRYIALGFPCVGITEHVPPVNDDFLYPDEKKLKLTAADLYKRFEDYFDTIKTLKKRYAARIKIYAGMETETCSGYVSHIRKLIRHFAPDYIVGSVHHVNDICFDYSKEDYEKLAGQLGSVLSMYKAYFDIQYEMIQKLKPFVVGHFDLIRIYDDDYEKRFEDPEIQQKINRNLELIKSLNLVLDYNLRPLAKGKKEPYLAEYILKIARKMEIQIVPGDDSHSITQAGLYVDQAVQTLKTLGFSTCWPTPVLLDQGK
ncbi:MAG: histidinol-phosphatase HisJ [Proteobacteria bacterium]|nr:histidinol-phosphatase HisJ [Pseudomonadota bacterium]MBU1387358.1 histidinol-phosphatase HisJ [Pseudomonadota bacterium]MBU1541643.1 histidinol-phosphatase HisJ [Pseudomonadota bacterium]MBU2430385.1 histidinol-phosphatase HisJ [Pseudomonadota bacterium]MBU2481029.1 histidinol-phosphatase HisJ [Pseudomonadota bacterium]